MRSRSCASRFRSAWNSRARAVSMAIGSSQPSRGDGIDDDDFGAVRFVQPLGDRLGDPARREILALGIDLALRRGDLVEVERLDLGQRPFRPSRVGPRDPDLARR